jgi:hypothetical protein
MSEAAIRLWLVPIPYRACHHCASAIALVAGHAFARTRKLMRAYLLHALGKRIHSQPCGNKCCGVWMPAPGHKLFIPRYHLHRFKVGVGILNADEMIYIIS